MSLTLIRVGFPILSSFFQASHFTTWERVVRAIKENLILYHDKHTKMAMSF